MGRNCARFQKKRKNDSDWELKGKGGDLFSEPLEAPIENQRIACPALEV